MIKENSEEQRDIINRTLNTYGKTAHKSKALWIGE